MRARADCLPTYQNIAKRARGDGPNIYKHVWAKGEEFEGTCPLCGTGVETLQHALAECPATLQLREETLKSIDARWSTAGMGKIWDRIWDTG